MASPSNDRAVRRGKWLRDLVNDEDAVRLRVVFEPWHVWATVEIGSAKVVKLDQVLIGAVHPLNNASQRREGHYRGNLWSEPAGRGTYAVAGGYEIPSKKADVFRDLEEKVARPESVVYLHTPEEAGIGTSPG